MTIPIEMTPDEGRLLLEQARLSGRDPAQYAHDIRPELNRPEETTSGLATVLLGDDVIDLKAQTVRCLGKSAVFADTLGPFSHTPIEVCWYGHGFMSRGRRASGLGGRVIRGSQAGRPRE